MAKPVTHLSKVTEHRGVTFTSTLCRRMSNANDDLNVTAIEAEVTCKFCLKQMEYRSEAAGAEILRKLRASERMSS